jgi:MoaA/NifB/PqqE/SkfB family radical SAM enzyme
MRNHWNVTYGDMSPTTFAHIFNQLGGLQAAPTVLFGGIGEPTYHPALPEMIAQVKAIGCRVEMITNGTLLTADRSAQIINAGLDMMWVSIDGAHAESYADVRLGAHLERVIENMKRFRRLRRPGHRPVPEMGIAFVAMKRNIKELPQLLALAKRLGVTQFHVSNLLPHSEEACAEILYERALNSITYLPSPWLRQLQLPKLDYFDEVSASFIAALSSGYNVVLAGNNLGHSNDVCTFIESGSLTVGWDGRVAPCPPLLYTHTSYLRGYERISRQHIIGNVNDRNLLEIWLDPEYVAYRERVHEFAFAPCTSCGGCDLSRDNQTDCFTVAAPACGGCLWAQGIISCP